MAEEPKELKTAVSLMRMALGLLDRSAHELASITGCHLQAAIDTATAQKPMQEGDELDPELAARLLQPRPDEQH